MVVCLFSFGHCVVCSSSIYGFWWTLWYLQTLLTCLLCSSLIGTCSIYYADRTNTWICYLNVREGAIENWQSRETGNIEFTRQTQKQQKSKKQATTQMSNTQPTNKTGGEPRYSWRVISSYLYKTPQCYSYSHIF